MQQNNLKKWSLVMISVADVDGFKICIRVCEWLGFLQLMPLIRYFKKT